MSTHTSKSPAQRRLWRLTLTVVAVAAAAATVALPLQTAAASASDIAWTDALKLGIHGRADWGPGSQFSSPYVRLPNRAQGVVTGAVWSLSQTPTGFSVCVSTTATNFYVRFNVTNVENGDWLWAINGHQGVDVYVSHAASNQQWRWATSSGNNAHLAQTVAAEGSHHVSFNMTLAPMLAGPKNITVYLPSRGLLASVELGVPVGETLAPVAPFPGPALPPVVYYGTSIVHGAATTRPGMVLTNQLARMLSRPVLNLGFSGNGKMQPGTGQFLAELANQSAVIVCDCHYNMIGISTAEVKNLTLALAQRLRAAGKAEIVIVEGHPPTRGWIDAGEAEGYAATAAGYRQAFNELINASSPSHITGLHYLVGDLKFGGPVDTDFEAQVSAVGGVHPTNLAFRNMAFYVGGLVARVLNGTAPPPTPIPMPSGWTGHEKKESKEGLQAEEHNQAPVLADRMVWTDATALVVDGKGFPLSTAPTYGRLPQAAQSDIPPGIWELSTDSSGLVVRFSIEGTGAPQNAAINIIRNITSTLQDDIMPWNGRYGIDVYIQDANAPAWRYAFTSTSGSQQTNETLPMALPALAKGAQRNFSVYLPTHSAALEVRVGTVAGEPQPRPLHVYPAGTAPITLWGSSIAQGGVVANAALTWPKHLERLTGLPVNNFGFSGSCQMQESVASWLVRAQKPKMFLMDCLPNMDAALVANRTVPVVQQLRAALGPDVAIVLLEGHTYSNAWILTDVQAHQQAKRAAQKAAFEKLRQTDSKLFYIEGDGKLASLGDGQYEATAGVGVHPTSLAHLRIAAYVAEQLKAISAAG